MSDRIQDLTNHRKVAVACKNYIDKEIKASEERILSIVARNNVDFIDHTDEATYRFTAPANAKLLMLQSIGGNTVKLSPSVANDSTKAMIKTMPSVVYTFDGSKFYGDSKISENLLVIADKSTTTANGITYSISNGVITLNGTATSDTIIVLNSSVSFNVESYTIRDLGNFYIADTCYCHVNNLWQNFTSSGKTFSVSTAQNQIIYLYVKNGTTLTNAISKPMLVKGSTAPTEFKVGYEGIHNLELSGLKVEGANRLSVQDESQTTFRDVTYKIENSAITIINNSNTSNTNKTVLTYTLPKGTYYFKSFGATGSNSTYFTYLEKTADGTTLALSYNNTSFTLTEDTEVRYTFAVRANVSATNIQFKDMLVLGSTAPTSFVPYITPTTIQVDLTSIEDSGGNKLFADGSIKGVGNVADEITPYKAVKRFGIVDLGSLNWGYDSSQQYSRFFYNDLGAKIQSTGIPNALIINNYTLVASNALTIDKAYTIYNGRLYIQDSDYTDATTFKTAMSGVYLVYELETPIEVSIDWSSTLRGIQGYSNGSIIAENTNNMEVESVITYNSIIQETLCPSITITRNGVDILTRNLPTQASDGWSAGTQRNYRVFCDDEGNEVAKRENNVDKNSDLGSLNYTYNADNYKIFASGTETQQQLGFKAQTQTLSKLYTYATAFSSFTTTDKCIYLSTDGNLYARDSYYNDATIFKTSLANEPLYYELADTSKTETDMDDFDYFFDVEEGDIITFNNPYAQQVYATYSFLIKEAKSNE